jgi:DMSO/TMAO reductase YedYZ molybdopterin-dependent catalytic subunit
MAEASTRRETLRRGLAATGLLATLEAWTTAIFGQSEADMQFTDIPDNFTAGSSTARSRILDIRKIDGLITPKDQFFAVQHFGRPQVDPAAYRLKITGMVKEPASVSLADLRAMRPTKLIAGFECSGNSGRSVQGLSSNGRWTGVPLSKLLKQAGVHSRAREVVFFGADRGVEDVVFRQQTFKLEQQFGRSMTLENALKPDLLVAYALNGEPLTCEQGFPVRLIVPGWYGVANVKWLAEVHLQEDRYLGNYQARWYRSLRGEGGSGEESDPQVRWVETEVTRMRLKSVIARVRKAGASYQVFGFVLNDGTPLKSVEVQIDNGPWRQAAIDPSHTKYSWKLFTHNWEGASPGEHTLVSRATDAEGMMQPAASDLKRKRTFLEDNAQFPRRVKIS